MVARAEVIVLENKPDSSYFQTHIDPFQSHRAGLSTVEGFGKSLTGNGSRYRHFIN